GHGDDPPAHDRSRADRTQRLLTRHDVHGIFSSRPTVAGLPLIMAAAAASRYEALPGVSQYSARSMVTRRTDRCSSSSPLGYQALCSKDQSSAASALSRRIRACPVTTT